MYRHLLPSLLIVFLFPVCLIGQGNRQLAPFLGKPKMEMQQKVVIPPTKKREIIAMSACSALLK